MFLSQYYKAIKKDLISKEYMICYIIQIFEVAKECCEHLGQTPNGCAGTF